MSERKQDRRWPRRFSIVLRALAALVVAELALRWILFVPAEHVLGPVHPVLDWFRRPGLWADSRNDDLYWSLQHRWMPPAERPQRAPDFDTQLGWVSTKFHPPTYWHIAEKGIVGRRPLLLYGGTFVLCQTLARDCFQGLLRRTDADAEVFALNYGVDGYGLDQSYLLMKDSLGLYEELDPVVVFAILVDDELDRSLLTFRRYTKPRLRASPVGALPDVAPEPDYASWIQERGPVVPSFLWRGLTQRFPLVPEAAREWLRGEQARRADTRELTRSILAGVRTEVQARSLEYFVVLLYGHRSIHHEPWGWREPFLIETLDALGIPFVSVRRDVQRVAFDNGLRVQDMFDGSEGVPGTGFYTPLANQGALNSILRGLRGEFDGRAGKQR